ncbi:MAG: hypothetical protein Q4D51_03385 [Eubacteriales bacterium]|nr:hypothetical protein [Eubacteriales bacterium]
MDAMLEKPNKFIDNQELEEYNRERCKFIRGTDDKNGTKERKATT